MQLGYALKNNRVKNTDEVLVAQFERIGLTEQGFDPKKLSPEKVNGLKRALVDGPVVASTAATETIIVGNGWNYSRLTEFGYNYPLPAVIAGPYLGGYFSQEAVYPIRYTDSNGHALSGANRYEITFDKVPPVGAFWSITMDNTGDRMPVENPIKRYKVGSDTPGLNIKSNGLFTIPIQSDEPQGPDKANWLPAPRCRPSSVWPRRSQTSTSTVQKYGTTPLIRWPTKR